MSPTNGILVRGGCIPRTALPIRKRVQLTFPESLTRGFLQLGFNKLTDFLEALLKRA